MSNEIVKLAVVVSVIMVVGGQYLASKAQQKPIVVAALPATPAPDTRLGRNMELIADARGHFRADVEVERQNVAMLVDTGATQITLTYEDAEFIGLHPLPADFTIKVMTANGSTQAAPVHLATVRLGQIEVRDVDANIAARGALSQSLLGMSFLRKLRGFDFSNGKLLLRQ